MNVQFMCWGPGVITGHYSIGEMRGQIRRLDNPHSQNVKNRPQLGKGFWTGGVSAVEQRMQSQIMGYKLKAYDLLERAFQTALKTAFSCNSKNSLDSSCLADQKPSFLFRYQFSHYPRFPFDYSMNLHSRSPAP